MRLPLPVQLRFSFRFPFLLLALTLVASAGARAEMLAGRLLAVLDGDTLTVELPTRGPTQLQLAWVDAPDREQPGGEAARASLEALSFGQAVQIDLVGEKDGRLRAVVYAVAAGASCSVPDCPQATDLGLAQLVRGMAWHDRRALGQPAQSLRQYEQAEFNAKIRRRGLWAAKNPLPPWDRLRR